MSEKGTYSDPRCYACMPAEEAMGVTATVTVKHGWREVDGVAWERLSLPIEGSYNRFADRIAEAINKRIPGPDLNNDVLRKARSE